MEQTKDLLEEFEPPQCFEEIKQKFDDSKAWGLLSSLDLHDCDPEKIRDSECIKEYVVQLCELIKMKRFGDCTVVNFGEDEKVAGFSMTQLIETSLIAGHFANLTSNVYIDIFSCKLYDPFEAAEFTKNFFGAKDYKLHFIFRV